MAVRPLTRAFPPTVRATNGLSGACEEAALRRATRGRALPWSPCSSAIVANWEGRLRGPPGIAL